MKSDSKTFLQSENEKSFEQAFNGSCFFSPMASLAFFFAISSDERLGKMQTISVNCKTNGKFNNLCTVNRVSKYFIVLRSVIYWLKIKEKSWMISNESLSEPRQISEKMVFKVSLYISLIFAVFDLTKCLRPEEQTRKIFYWLICFDFTDLCWKLLIC